MLKYSQTPGPSKCAAINGAQHIFSAAKLFQTMISKSVHHFGTTTGVIRVRTKHNQDTVVPVYCIVANVKVSYRYRGPPPWGSYRREATPRSLPLGSGLDPEDRGPSGHLEHVFLPLKPILEARFSASGILQYVYCRYSIHVKPIEQSFCN